MSLPIIVWYAAVVQAVMKSEEILSALNRIFIVLHPKMSIRPRQIFFSGQKLVLHVDRR